MNNLKIYCLCIHDELFDKVKKFMQAAKKHGV